jgi:SAM-dependent methyltransferase/uncharacterized protein YbaR (Trm112 family)
VRRSHFEALRPACPRCRLAGRGTQPLTLALVEIEAGSDVVEGILHCPEPACRHEFPIIDGIPIIVPEVAAFLSSQLTQITAGDGFGPAIESLLGDAAGPGSGYEAGRQHLSTYAWDGYGEADPQEEAGGPRPGAVKRCLEVMLELAGPMPAGPILDLGCSVGASSFALAARSHDVVLGVDLNIAMLRFARRTMLSGRVSYARRRVGLVYDRRDFAVALDGAGRVDFWCCDALALPFPDKAFALITALNVLDCLSSPLDFLQRIGDVLAQGGKLCLATPYDWSAQVTAPSAWIGGHSQRGPQGGAAEPLLAALLTPDGHPQSIDGLRLIGEILDWPWQTRLHDRSTVAYSAHLVAAERAG